MPPKFYKHRLLLDEGLYPRKSLKRVNGRHNIRHIKHDVHKGGITDIEIYKLACAQKRIIITYNIKDFQKLAVKKKDSGVIGITAKLTPDQLDTKLNSFLSRHPENSLYGKYMALSVR
mgnify:CR=1 FL=1